MNKETERDPNSVLVGSDNYYFLFSPKEVRSESINKSWLFSNYLWLTLLLLCTALFSAYWFLLQPFKAELESRFTDYFHSPSAYFVALWLLLTAAVLTYNIYLVFIARKTAYSLNVRGSELANSLFLLETTLRKELKTLKERQERQKLKSAGPSPALLTSGGETSTAVVDARQSVLDSEYVDVDEPSQQSNDPDVPWEKYDTLLETYGVAK